MEPIDDILTPSVPPKRNSRRLASRHVLRLLAVILVASALAYLGKVLKLDSEKLVSHSREDMLATVPVFLFAALLWWFAGRRVDEFSRPLFRSKGDSATEPRVDVQNFFWLGACLVSGFVGMTAIIIGATFARYGGDLKRAMPEFFVQLEKSMPQVQRLEASPTPLILAGFFLVLVAGVCLTLAARRRQRPA